MILSSNLHRFHQSFGLKKTIDIFADAGFEGIDFNTDIEEYYTDVHSPEFYKEIRKYANDKGIVFYQTHAPFRSSFPDADKTEQRFWEIVKSMQHSSLLGAEMTVVHPCNHLPYKEGENRDIMMEYNIDFYNRLRPYAEENGIRIAIENIHNYITESPENLLELLDALNSDVFTICYDVGHDYIATKDPTDMISKIGSRIGCTHIHDNDGTIDRHTLPYYGDIDWEAVMKAFARSGYAGNLNYEAAYFASKLPAEFLPEGAKYMAAVGKHLISRYHHYKALG